MCPILKARHYSDAGAGTNLAIFKRGHFSTRKPELFYKLLLKSTYFDSLKNLSFNFSGRRRKGIKSTKLSANTLTSFDNTRKWQKVGQIMNLQFAIDRDEINQGKFGGHCSSLRQVNKADWRLNCAFVIPVGAGDGFGQNQISFQSTFLEAEYQKAFNTFSFYQEPTYFWQTDGF